ncbi:hypothetical protein BS78_02G279900 [Paspalum vaginatum]|nr:hypothetical protein BS78_02G279900 [Paspalum vaginatum]
MSAADACGAAPACCTEPAAPYCPDEAALCSVCDRRAYHTYNLADRERRTPVVQPANRAPVEAADLEEGEIPATRELVGAAGSTELRPRPWSDIPTASTGGYALQEECDSMQTTCSTPGRTELWDAFCGATQEVEDRDAGAEDARCNEGTSTDLAFSLAAAAEEPTLSELVCSIGVESRPSPCHNPALSAEKICEQFWTDMGLPSESRWWEDGDQNVLDQTPPSSMRDPQHLMF